MIRQQRLDFTQLGDSIRLPSERRHRFWSVAVRYLAVHALDTDKPVSVTRAQSL